MQYYLYSDSGAFTQDPYFNTCIERIIAQTRDTYMLIKHRLFQAEHVNISPDLYKIASDIRKHYRHVVVLGMGGAILNPHMVTSFYPSSNILIYCDHINSHILNHLAVTLDLEHTAFLVISKSGYTIETLSLVATWYSYLQKIGDLAQQFYVITGPQDSPLRQLAYNIGAHLLEHEPDISGRYASFTNITLLPGLIAGLDMEAFCQGGRSTLQQLLENPSSSPIIRGAATLLYMMERKIPQLVTMPYLSTLKNFTEWQAQIVAESLGKEGCGITPIKATGPLDQHSQLQLYLDGPRDKFFNMIYSADRTTYNTPIMTIGPLAGKSLHEICNAEYSAMLATLSDYQLPYRTITLSYENEASLGALIMHSMLEVALCGLSRGIDPFNQPAVESIKIHIHKALSK